MFGNTGGHVVGGHVTGHESPADHQPFPATFNDAHHVYLTDTPQDTVDEPRRNGLATWMRVHGGLGAGAIVVAGILLVALLIAFI
ncbi:MAG: hypothetical protein ACRDPY_08915 [Streptosporangiaceae bacterium]